MFFLLPEILFIFRNKSYIGFIIFKVGGKYLFMEYILFLYLQISIINLFINQRSDDIRNKIYQSVFFSIKNWL